MSTVVVPRMVVDSRLRVGSVPFGPAKTSTASRAPRTRDEPSGRDSTSRASSTVVVVAIEVVVVGGVVVAAATLVVGATVEAGSVASALAQPATARLRTTVRAMRRISRNGIGTLEGNCSALPG